MRITEKSSISKKDLEKRLLTRIGALESKIKADEQFAVSEAKKCISLKQITDLINRLCANHNNMRTLIAQYEEAYDYLGFIGNRKIELNQDSYNHFFRDAFRKEPC